jgi:hypothetical protein
LVGVATAPFAVGPFTLARAFAPEPYPGVIARPNCETPNADGCSLETITA